MSKKRQSEFSSSSETISELVLFRNSGVWKYATHLDNKLNSTMT